MSSLRKYLPHFVVFVSSMGIMIIELVASRIIAKYLGNSLYTWTSIIGVVLGGIALGNYLGGRIADRYDVRKSARVLLLTAAGLVLLILALDIGVGAAMNHLTLPDQRVFLIIVAVLVIGLLFFLPATALGTISPIMAKYALEESEHIGTTVGSIYASGSAGSIIGTFLSGFLLVPLLGIRTVVITVAAVIALLTLFIRGKRKSLAGILVGLGMLLFFLVIGPTMGIIPWLDREAGVLYEEDSMYSHITVKDRSPEERVLIMDGLVHNFYNPENPDELIYSYEQIYRTVTEQYIHRMKGDEPLNTLTLGGGALTFPSYIERHYPKSNNTVVEIDPQVIEVAHRYFDIPRNTKLNIRIADARQYVRNFKEEKKFDIVYLDVFDSYSIPSHLTTEEFSEEVKGLLKSEGILLVNLIDIYSEGRFLGAYSRTVEKIFEEVQVYTSPNFDRNSRNTFVLLAGSDLEDFGLLTGPEGRNYELIDKKELDLLQERTGSPILTDNQSPVEILLAPVFLHALF